MFSGIGPLGEGNLTGSGTINFSPDIPVGGSTYFSLESPPAGGFGSTSSLTTMLSGGGQTNDSITVLQGTPVTDSATLGGVNASIATGNVAYNIYSDSSCTQLASAAGEGLAAGKAAASSAANLAPGVYYWKASYGGDPNNKAIASECGSKVLTVQAPTTTTTIQSGGGVIGASIPVLKGAVVTDTALIAGAQAVGATGTVVYTLYKDAACKTVLTSSVASVTGGVALPSAPVSPAVGTYYWVVSYSGSGPNAPSSSVCGSEKLIVSTKKNLGLPSGKKCFSNGHSDPPAVPERRQDRLLRGVHQRQTRQAGQAQQKRHLGQPDWATQRRVQSELVTFTSSGASYEDTRTFHTCVRKKHKHHH